MSGRSTRLSKKKGLSPVIQVGHLPLPWQEELMREGEDGCQKGRGKLQEKETEKTKER